MPDDKTGFIDTNIWLYAFIDDDARKKDISQAIIQSLRPVVSVQVINEICVNLIKRAKFPEAQIVELIETFYQKYEVVEVEKELLLSASRLRQDYTLSYWDSLVAAAALSGGTTTLYSEDMQHDLLIAGRVRITNPFKS